MERPTPDLTGYREAQIALIAQLGSEVEFFLPAGVVWPPEAILDPETGEPYDPSVLPVSSGFSSASVKCGIAIRSRGGVAKDEEILTAIGPFENGEGALLVPVADYEANSLDEATEAVVYNERYDITQADEDGLADQIHRVIVYIRQKGLG
jgi:hypothetical protein